MQLTQHNYHPGPSDDWERKEPQEVGMSASRLDEVISYAKAHETSWSRELAAHYDETDPRNEVIGPIRNQRSNQRSYPPARIHRSRVGRYQES